jgi:hypothetical protein
MRVAVYIKKRNLESGFISLRTNIPRAFWNGEIEAIDVFTEDKVFLESYFGNGLEDLMCNLKAFRNADGETIYFLAKRWLKDS